MATGEVVAEHAFDLVEDPPSLAPRPVGSVEWSDPEFCRLVSVTRDEARQRFSLPPAGPLCGISR